MVLLAAIEQWLCVRRGRERRRLRGVKVRHIYVCVLRDLEADEVEYKTGGSWYENTRKRKGKL